jgi:hypothetical protein
MLEKMGLLVARRAIAFTCIQHVEPLRNQPRIFIAKFDPTSAVLPAYL